MVHPSKKEMIYNNGARNNLRKEQENLIVRIITETTKPAYHPFPVRQCGAFLGRDFSGFSVVFAINKLEFLSRHFAVQNRSWTCHGRMTRRMS
jgi:hypothetical protein